MPLLLIALVVSLFVYYHWSRRRFYAAEANYHGPRGLPIIGNALEFMCNAEDFHEKLKKLFSQVKEKPFRFWLGPHLLLSFKNPIHLEKIMSAQKFAYKHDIYALLEEQIGDGLISASGLKPKYKVHRKTIIPMLDLKYVTSALLIIQHHIEICLKKLEKHVDMGTFDVVSAIGPCSMDIIGEIIMGQKVNSQKTDHCQFSHAVINMMDVTFKRILQIWLHPKFIFRWHPLYREMEKSAHIVNSFVNKAISDSYQRRRTTTDKEEFIPLIDSLVNVKENNPNVISMQDLRHHLMTLMLASEDTFGIVTSFTVMCLGMYPEYQKIAVEEIRRLVGEEKKEITLDDTYKLEYLDMCIKDVMRLFPIAPYIIRKAGEDYQIDQYKVPAGAGIIVPIFHLHRDSDFWENPEHFHPDHFLPEAVKKRHPYTYLPFSTGPRGCIGKLLANVQIKLFIARFLQEFAIEADGKVPDLQLKEDISIRPKFGYNIRLKKREWF
nr:cytochrome P450 [Agasicles hygrophila]